MLHNSNSSPFVVRSVLQAMPEFKAHLGTLVSCSQRYDRAKTELENCEYAKGKQGHHTRLHIEANLLEQCQIVFVTLSSAGHPSLQNTRKFEVVIVDEAAQCVEPSTLIALELGSHHTVLVGDPKQVRGCEERGDELRSRVYGVLVLFSQSAAANFDTIF